MLQERCLPGAYLREGTHRDGPPHPSAFRGRPVRKTFASAFLLASLSFTLFGAAPPAAVPGEWLKLIERLGSDDEDDRKAAEKKLSDLGEDVLPALRKAGKSHDDADVRLRAVVIAASIEDRLYGKERQLTGSGDGVITLAVSGDGRRIASGAWKDSNDLSVRVWDVQTGKQVQKLDGHTQAVAALAWSKDGKQILSGSLDRTLRLWDVG